MDLSTAIGLVQEALMVSLQVPGPILGAILLVGLGISVFQAVTQINEMTLVFVPKVILTYLIVYFLGNWMLFTLVNFSNKIFLRIPSLVQ